MAVARQPSGHSPCWPGSSPVAWLLAVARTARTARVARERLTMLPTGRKGYWQEGPLAERSPVRGLAAELQWKPGLLAV